MGRRRKSGGKGNGSAAVNDSPSDGETPTPTPPPRISGAEGRSAARVVAEAEAKSAEPVILMPSVEPAQQSVAAEVATADAPNTSDAVAALNTYAYQSSVNETAAGGIVVEDDDADDKEAAPTANSLAAPASPPRVSDKRVVVTSAASASSSNHEEKLREAQCVESVCTYCTLM
ncbi:hypothetical_protein [Leishmania major strain Friedlin]|nr:hypothetical_protein [Leishmania major strain Friedlin]